MRRGIKRTIFSAFLALVFLTVTGAVSSAGTFVDFVRIEDASGTGRYMSLDVGDDTIPHMSYAGYDDSNNDVIRYATLDGSDVIIENAFNPPGNDSARENCLALDKSGSVDIPGIAFD